MNSALPKVFEFPEPPDVVHCLQAVAHLPGVSLFDSALQQKQLGRYSFLTADPFQLFQIEKAQYGSDPFIELRAQFSKFQIPAVAELPPFQGGAAGVLSYELGQAWEKIPIPAGNEFDIPQMAVGLYDWVLAWDHRQNRAWLISQGLPETDLEKRSRCAEDRIQQIKNLLDQSESTAEDRPSTHQLMASELVPQFPLAGSAEITTNFSRDDYLNSAEKVIEYIHAGDIFQANLSQRLLCPQRISSVELYTALREKNPAPFAGYFSFDDWSVLSSSPERFLSVQNGEVETRPIKGTRARKGVSEADLFTRDELRESEKDQAENVMIVDLLRNDLSRVCKPGTIQVPHLCIVESYETVQHLVTEIRGKLRDDQSIWDLLSVTFPGGSITGAPKVRAMEIISELEPTVRGPYCGSLFYAGFDGSFDSNILIRTMTARNGWVQLPVGGGIVAQSDAQSEYQETLHKAEGMLRALAASSD